jgi:hypothetical protein
MVHAGFLNLFLSFYRSSVFQNQILEIMNTRKSVVFAGHSIGGTIASLSALWLLSSLKSLSTSLSILCITFGSPLLGNAPLSLSVLHNRWSGNFCHVINRHDIVPRLLFAPLAPLASVLHSLLQYWHLSMMTPSSLSLQHCQLAVPLDDLEKHKLFELVLAAMEEEEMKSGSLGFRPFGNFLFFGGKEGAVCVDNDAAVVKMLRLMLAMGSPGSGIDDHIRYGEYVAVLSVQFMTRKLGFVDIELPQSSYEAGLALALQSSGLTGQDAVCERAKDCLKMAKRLGRAPSLNSANLAIGLSKITPLRAQLEWYKSSCDKSSDQMGYYDSFKQRGASKKGSKVYMNCKKLGVFWDEVIKMLETEQLPHDFLKREKWINASHFYKLLVEPLDIAEYYRSGDQNKKGYYMTHGRARRYKIFDRWWRELKSNYEENTKTRRKFASLTQDSCFWAHVEEARELLESVRSERDPRKISQIWENIHKFEEYAKRMIEMKEVSVDVLLKNSSYSLWVEEMGELKMHLHKFSHVSSLLNGEVIP